MSESVLHLTSSVFWLSVLVGNFPLESTMSDSIRSKVIKLAASFPAGSDARKSLLKVLGASTQNAATVPVSIERTMTATPKWEKVETPDWLKVGVRVRKNGDWPRVGLLDGAEGTVKSLDIDPVTGFLRWFTVVWDDLDNYKRGVEHYGWHAVMGHVTPVK